MKITWSSLKKATFPITVGPVMAVDLPVLGIKHMAAKVDTGAFSGALHATHIGEVKTEGHKTKLRFSPLGSVDHTLELAKFHKRTVKSSNGSVEIRYAIDTEIVIKGRVYPITITLTDRKTMTYPMLIGRKFLKLHGFLVDVSKDNR